MASMGLMTGNILSTNLFTYCNNDPINRIDPTGYMSIQQIANAVTPAALFNMFMLLLYQDIAKGLLKVGLYVTKILTPITAKAFWWKPLAIVGIIVVAVAIVVTAVTIYANNKISSTIRNINTRIYQKYKTDFKYAGKGNPNDLKRGMSKNQMEKFQRAIEDMKKYSGKPPNFNLPWPVLVELANEIKKSFK